MKIRIISAIVCLAIFIPIFMAGGIVFKIAMGILTLLGFKEFLDIKESKKALPNFIKVISYFLVLMLMINIEIDESYKIIFDFRLLTGLCLVAFIPVVLYHNRDIYSVNDSYYVVASTLFLGISMSYLVLYRNMSFHLLVYLFMITVITDTFAYFTGYLIGKHKLLEVISPKKTWEGLFGGTIMGVFVSTVYYLTAINGNVSIVTLVLITTFLSIIGQFGDLFFSAIKRYYGKKDFSNIMPGHGGVLDRLDSIIFVMLAYSFFMELI